MNKKAMTTFEREMAERANKQAAAERATTASNFISTKGGILSFSGEPIADNQIDVAILAAPVERMYYASRYDPDNPSGPACFALSDTGVRVKPSPASVDQQSDMCADCPQNEWGSSTTGRGKACRETRRLLMIPAGELKDCEPDNIAGKEVVGLRPPVTSVKNFSNYVQGIANVHKRPLGTVVTRVKLTPDPKTQFKLSFELVDQIADNKIAMALLERADAEVKLAMEAVAQGHGEGDAKKVEKSDKF